MFALEMVIALQEEYEFTRHTKVGRLFKAEKKVQLHIIMAEGSGVFAELKVPTFGTATGTQLSGKYANI